MSAGGDQDTATVDVTVTPANDPPVADNDTLTVAEDAGPTVVNVLAGDSDPENDALDISAVTQGAKGAVVITGGGSGLTYDPATNATGADRFTYTVSDGNGGTDIGTVTVTITPANDPPVADNDTLTVAEDAGPTVVNVLAGDSDPEGDDPGHQRGHPGRQGRRRHHRWRHRPDLRPDHQRDRRRLASRTPSRTATAGRTRDGHGHDHPGQRPPGRRQRHADRGRGRRADGRQRPGRRQRSRRRRPWTSARSPRAPTARWTSAAAAPA